jgi:hypothetical protein
MAVVWLDATAMEAFSSRSVKTWNSSSALRRPGRRRDPQRQPRHPPRRRSLRHAKYFSERIPATVLTTPASMSSAPGCCPAPAASRSPGASIAGRFGMIRTTAFPRGEYWTALISALEDSLRLHRHQPGALTGLGESLHRRTGGMIGSLLRLIRGAAIQAVLDGTEEISRTTLDSAPHPGPARPGDQAERGWMLLYVSGGGWLPTLLSRLPSTQPRSSGGNPPRTAGPPGQRTGSGAAA